jgi:2-hydroxychromene-2-carboxylate isomerase
VTKPTVDLYYSFRSPYSWLAFHRLMRVRSHLPVALKLYPGFPDPAGPEPGVTADSRRLMYLIRDVGRISAAYGLSIHWPPRIDVDWMPPHAGMYFAVARGVGERYVREAFRSRFELGEDLGDNEVLGGIACRCDLDPTDLVAACHNPEFHERVRESLARFREEEVFGVPTFVFEGRVYWGNDRLEWLLRDVFGHLGREVPALDSNLFRSPCPDPEGAA